MKYAHKIILHAPVPDEQLLEPFVEQCLRDEVSIIAVIGPDSGRVEDIIDEIVVGDGSDPDRYVCTSSHTHETFDEVVGFLQSWDSDRGNVYQEVRL